MINLFPYELRKIINNKIIIAICFLFMFINFSIIYTNKNIELNSLPLSECEAILRQYDLDPEKVIKDYESVLEWDDVQEKRWQEEMTKGNLYWEIETKPSTYAKEGYTDRQYFEWLFDWLKREDNYREKVNNIIENANKNLRDLKSKGIGEDTYSWKYQLKVIYVYTQIMDQVCFNDEIQHGWSYYFNYKIVNVFIALLILLFASYQSIREKRDGTFNLINCTKRGRRPLLIIKVIVLVIICFIIVSLFSLETFLIIAAKIGFSSPMAFIQEVSEFIYCPYTIRIWQYTIIMLILKWIVFSTFALFVFAIGLFLPDYSIITISGISIIAINALLDTHCYLQPDNILKYINMQAVSQVTTLLNRYKGVNINGRIVDVISFTTSVYLLLFITIFIVILTLFRFRDNRLVILSHAKKRPFNKKHKYTQRQKTISQQTGLIYAEICKCLDSPLLISILLIIILLDSQWYKFDVIPPTSYTEQVYKEYITTLEGPLTQDKIDYIRNERAKINSILSICGNKKEEYLANKISVKEYTEYLTELYNADLRDEILSDIESYCEYLVNYQKEGVEAWFVYDTGWKALSNTSFDWGLFAIILILSTKAFPIEFIGNVSEHDTANIIRSTRKGRFKVWMSKYISVGLCVLFICFLLFGIQLLVLYNTYEFPMHEAPVSSLRFINNAEISILHFYINIYCVRLISVILFAYFCLSISSILKKQIPSIIICVLCIFSPTILSYFGETKISLFDYISFFRAVPLLNNRNCTFVILLYISIIVAFALISLFTWTHNINILPKARKCVVPSFNNHK